MYQGGRGVGWSVLRWKGSRIECIKVEGEKDGVYYGGMGVGWSIQNGRVRIEVKKDGS